MLSDLVAAECTERMEYYKTIAGEREYSIERTRSVKNADGTDSHVTYNIVTSHRECYLIVSASVPRPAMAVVYLPTQCLTTVLQHGPMLHVQGL